MTVYVFVDKIAGRYEVRGGYILLKGKTYHFPLNSLFGLSFESLDDIRDRIRAIIKTHGLPDTPIVFKPY